MKFPLGRVIGTSAALEALAAAGADVREPLGRHARGDWGVVSRGDARLNDQALQEGGRLLSVYELTDGTRIWIVTDADRASTTLLLPEEY